MAARVQCSRIHPVELVVSPSGATTDETPGQLTLPAGIVETVSKTGKTRLLYEFEVCGPTQVPSTIVHPTGFPELDRFLDTQIADLELVLPTVDGTCTTITLILDLYWACEVPQTG